DLSVYEVHRRRIDDAGLRRRRRRAMSPAAGRDRLGVRGELLVHRREGTGQAERGGGHRARLLFSTEEHGRRDDEDGEPASFHSSFDATSELYVYTPLLSKSGGISDRG